MEYGKNEEGENSKVDKVKGDPREEIQKLLRPWDSQEQHSITRKGSQCEASLRRGGHSKQGMKTFSTHKTGMKGSDERFDNHSHVFFICAKNGLVNQTCSLFIHVFIVDLIVPLYGQIFGRDNPCRRGYLGRRHKEKLVFQS